MIKSICVTVIHEYYEYVLRHPTIEIYSNYFNVPIKFISVYSTTVLQFMSYKNHDLL